MAIVETPRDKARFAARRLFPDLMAKRFRLWRKAAAAASVAYGIANRQPLICF